MAYTPKHKIRIVTAAALFDGHDAAINVMRRIMQSKGAEIIHLGHNRSVKEIVETADWSCLFSGLVAGLLEVKQATIGANKSIRKEKSLVTKAVTQVAQVANDLNT